MTRIFCILFCILAAYTVNKYSSADEILAQESSISVMPKDTGYIQDTEKILAECIKSDNFMAPQFGNNAGQKNNYQNLTFRKAPDSGKQIIYKKSVAAVSSIYKNIRIWDISVTAMLHEISSDYYIISLGKIRC